MDHVFSISPAMKQSLEPMIDKYIGQTKAQFVATSIAPAASDEYQAVHSSSSRSEDEERQSQAFNSLQIYWTTNLALNGGVSKVDQVTSLLRKDRAAAIENFLQKEEFGALGLSLEKLQVSLSTLLKSAFGISLADLKDLLVDTVATGSLELVRELLLLLGAASASMVDNLRKMMQSGLEIPMLSSLCRKLLRKPTITLRDVVCLLNAMPATIAYKIVSGKGPQSLTKEDAATRRLLDQADSNPLDAIKGCVNWLGDFIQKRKPLFNAANRFADLAVIGTTFYQLCPMADDRLVNPKIERTAFNSFKPIFLLLAWFASMPTRPPVSDMDRLRRFSWIFSGAPIFAQWQTSRRREMMLRFCLGIIQTVLHLGFIAEEWNSIVPGLVCISVTCWPRISQGSVVLH